MTQEVFVENRASEQAARVMAMQAANDNAKKLLDQLRLEYNKLRQQSITTELLDIVGDRCVTKYLYKNQSYCVRPVSTYLVI